jgi:outer membrane biosynthesis protein TonB
MTSTRTAPFNNMHWSKADHDLMISLLRDGKSYRQIAKSLGRTEKSIEQHAYQTRVKLRKAQVSEVAIKELMPTNPAPKRRRQKVVVSEMNDVKDLTGIKRPQPKPKQQPKPDPEPQEVEGALFERRIVELYVVTAVSAIGIWILAGAFIYSLI